MHAIVEAAGVKVFVILPDGRVALLLRVDTHMVVRKQQHQAGPAVQEVNSSVGVRTFLVRSRRCLTKSRRCPNR